MGSATTVAGAYTGASAAAVARGTAAGLSVGKAVSTCLKHPILCSAAAAIGVVAVKSLNRDRGTDLAAARQQEATGQPLTPPGFCPDETHSWLTATVENLCKDGTLNRCVETDTKLRLTAKALAFSACAKARAKRDDMCYRGGDPGHRTQIQQMWQAHNRCQMLVGLK
jgi:Novel toxin 16